MIDYTIFIVDDEGTIREGIALALAGEYHTETFSQAEDALEAISENTPDLILLDIGLPGMDGIQALREIKQRRPDILVIMITAYEDVDTVISAMKLGAYDYVIKPIHMEGLEVAIQNALETIRLRKEVRALQEEQLLADIPYFIAESDAIQEVMEFIGQVAKSPDTPVLLYGETGSGKELVARAVHYRSPNFRGPLVTVNCAAIPRDLIESELFGYEKGAFSGAMESGKKGLIEESDHGTLFLDEIGDLSPEAQAKLLRFLENGEFYRVGGTRKRQIQTRIVSATNKDLEDMVEQGEFRKDLFYRLAVIKIQIPSLHERVEDILPLARHFIEAFNRKFGKKIKNMSPEAENALLAHPLTGNVRELKNIMERAVLISKGPELASSDLGIEPGKPESAGSSDAPFTPLTESGIDLPALEESMERFYLEEAFRLAQGNESKAAKLLNLNHHTYRYRRKKLQTS